jgi:cysteine desulfurase/selenocysteine lyase
VARVRRDFPILDRMVHGRPLVYLDNAASTQKPAAVIDAISSFYRERNSNVHRGVHRLSQEATEAYEGARARLARWINAPDAREVIFTRGTTESINLVASSWGRARLRPGDEILLTQMEHHSNIVPWQLAAEATGAVVRAAPVTDEGELDLEGLARMLSPRTRIVALVHVSNALGTVNPVERVAAMAHGVGAVVVVDGAQSMQHLRVDVTRLGCDFFAFSGHKMFGPTGIGGLWGRGDLLQAMPPYQGGGDMIKSVRFDRTIYNDLPHKFEAGTPDVAGAVGLGATIEYLSRLEWAAVEAHERAVLSHALRSLAAVPGLRILGAPRHRVSAISFLLGDIHPHDIGTVVDHAGVAIRTGHHCTQPLMDRFGVPATARASFSLYNTTDEVDLLVSALHQVREVFG